MRINIIVEVGERVREKIKYGIALLFQPLRTEILFSDGIQHNAINILYGNESGTDHPSGVSNQLIIKSSAEFEDCIKSSRLPDISDLEWFQFNGKKIPKLFPVADKHFDFDIAAAAFMLASEFQDLISLERDEFDRLRAMDSLQDKLGILDVPVVNYYSIFLKKKIEELFKVKIQLKKYDDSDHGLALTHDVDYTSSLNFRMIKRNIFGHAILNHENLLPYDRATKLLYPILAFGGYNPPKSGLKFLKDTETQQGIKSTFFIKTGATAKQDMNYNHRSRPLRDFVKSLIASGFEIGIHPSMKTYIDGDQFILEKTRLEELTDTKINSVRQHYLKFTASKTVGIWEKAGMNYDCTLGFSRKAGFRNSVAFPFPLYDFEADKISTVIELPLIIMDGTFSGNKTLTADTAFAAMMNLIDETKAAHGAASILFHNSLTDPIDFPGYPNIYRHILTEAKGGGFKMDKLSGVIETFR